MRFFLILILSLVFYFVFCERKYQPFNSFEFKKETKEQLSKFSFVAMGCPWQVYYSKEKASFNADKIKQVIINKVAEYNETFSDWSAESELKQIEIKGFQVESCGSDLFFQGILQAKELYDLTNGVFDISLGEGDFSSLLVNRSKKCFSFTKKNPNKLTFNGFVKGMVLADLAKIFIRSGIKNFYINAGNGNLVFKIERNKKEIFALDFLTFPKGHEVVYFLSQSRAVQDNLSEKKQHIFDPSQKSKILQKDSRVICFSSLKEIKKWHQSASYADAFSTALTVDSKVSLPSSCQKL